MAEDNKLKPSLAETMRPTPVPPLKNSPEDTAPDPTRSVADPAAPGKTNPGPGANQDRPAMGPMSTSGPAAGGSSVSQPNQPIVPAPSENVFPGPVGRPDPSRTVEERQGVADAAIETDAARRSGRSHPTDRTSDGKPDESTVPAPKE